MRSVNRPVVAQPDVRDVPPRSVGLTASEITRLRRSLLRWFGECRRDLPWRRTTDPYAIWLSEVMLQQTRVEAVIPYYERFLKAFPTVGRLAKAPLERVLRLWAGLGYYSRARNLHAAAQTIVRDHSGAFPRSSAALRTLPGIGRYTAAAIASIAFSEPAAVLDGNVKRVLARMLAVGESIDRAATVARLWDEAERLLDRRHPGDFNQSMMELGATVCTPRSPHCEKCPVSAVCKAAALGIARDLPMRNPKRAVAAVFAAAAAIVEDGRVLLMKRSERGLLAGFWTLPTCERTGRDTTPHDLARSISSQLNAGIAIGGKLGEVRHEFTHRSLSLEIFAAQFRDRNPLAASVRESSRRLVWHKLGGEARVPLAAVDQKAISLVESAFASTASCD